MNFEIFTKELQLQCFSLFWGYFLSKSCSIWLENSFFLLWIIDLIVQLFPCSCTHGTWGNVLNRYVLALISMLVLDETLWGKSNVIIEARRRKTTNKTYEMHKKDFIEISGWIWVHIHCIKQFNETKIFSNGKVGHKCLVSVYVEFLWSP